MKRDWILPLMQMILCNQATDLWLLYIDRNQHRAETRMQDLILYQSSPTSFPFDHPVTNHVNIHKVEHKFISNLAMETHLSHLKI